MNLLSAQQISMLKKGLVAYWVSVLVVALLFLDSRFGQKYVFFGAFIMFAHVVETFLFDKILQEHSDNVLKDKFLMLPFGFLIPASLKVQAEASQQQAEKQLEASDSSSN
jgi:hypothetical protein